MYRRTFLATTAIGATALSGCGARGEPDHDPIEAGVEWKTISGLRENRYRKIVSSHPGDPPVTTDAPMDTELRNRAYDDEFVSFSSEGPLDVSDETAERLADAYEEVHYVLVVTVYAEDERNGIPEHGAYGYRTNLEAFDDVQAGDLVTFTPETRDDVPWIDGIEDVTSARE